MQKEKAIIKSLKGYAILLVVFHHTVFAVMTDSLLNVFAARILNSIHVVIFFLISGYLFEANEKKYRNQKWNVFFANKALQLLIPYYFFSLVISLLIKIGCIINNSSTLMGYNPKNWINIFIDPIIYKDPYFDSLWYIYILFVGFIICWIINSRYINVFSVGLLLILHLIINAYFDLDILIIRLFLKNIIFLILGRFIFKERFQLEIIYKKHIKIIVIVGVVVFCAVFSRIMFVDLTHLLNSFALRAFFIQIENLLLSISSIILLIYIITKFGCKTEYGIQFFGKYSYKIYLIHNPWIVSMLAIILEHFLGKGLLMVFIIWPLSVVISICFIKLIDKLFKPISKFCFGELRIKGTK